MGLPVLFRRASDLLDKYVGETEKQIAAAFAEAVDTNSFLIFDEADSLIADRRGAVRNWEVSQTNEMLTWMERHPLPFCCTTNFADRLDEAAMRRFLVKAQFGFLRPEQTALAFRQVFQLAPPAGLAALDRLTPADFDLVKRGAILQGTMQDPQALLDALRREQRAKADVSNPIGFRLSA
jgi:SpoVK/Ycf46/Vps4 family AAA+-type ATPase